jgi:hypothetical protein
MRGACVRLRDSGKDGTPEYAAWCESLGDAGKEYEALMANVKSAEESHKQWLAAKAEEERRKLIALEVEEVEGPVHPMLPRVHACARA